MIKTIAHRCPGHQNRRAWWNRLLSELRVRVQTSWSPVRSLLFAGMLLGRVYRHRFDNCGMCAAIRRLLKLAQMLYVEVSLPHGSQTE